MENIQELLKKREELLKRVEEEELLELLDYDKWWHGRRGNETDVEHAQKLIDSLTTQKEQIEAWSSEKPNMNFDGEQFAHRLQEFATLVATIEKHCAVKTAEEGQRQTEPKKVEAKPEKPREIK